MNRITIEVEGDSCVAFFRDSKGELSFFEQLPRNEQVDILNGLASIHKLVRPLLKEK